MFIRTGSIITSGERVLCGLAQQFGTLCFIDDNAGCFGGRPLPANGSILSFGELQVFVATELPREYPAKVFVAEDPPSVCAVRGQRNARPATYAEVLMTAPVVGAGGAGVDAGAGAEAHAEDGDEDDGLERHPRGSRFPLERVVPTEAGPSRTPKQPSSINRTIAKLHQPIPVGADVTLCHEQLEARREYVLEQAQVVAAKKRDLEWSIR